MLPPRPCTAPGAALATLRAPVCELSPQGGGGHHLNMGYIAAKLRCRSIKMAAPPHHWLTTVYSGGGTGRGAYSAGPCRLSEGLLFFGRRCAIFLAPLNSADGEEGGGHGAGEISPGAAAGRGCNGRCRPREPARGRRPSAQPCCRSTLRGRPRPCPLAPPLLQRERLAGSPTDCAAPLATRQPPMRVQRLAGGTGLRACKAARVALSRGLVAQVTTVLPAASVGAPLVVGSVTNMAPLCYPGLYATRSSSAGRKWGGTGNVGCGATQERQRRK